MVDPGWLGGFGIIKWISMKIQQYAIRDMVRQTTKSKSSNASQKFDLRTSNFNHGYRVLCAVSYVYHTVPGVLFYGIHLLSNFHCQWNQPPLAFLCSEFSSLEWLFFGVVCGSEKHGDMMTSYYIDRIVIHIRLCCWSLLISVSARSIPPSSTNCYSNYHRSSIHYSPFTVQQ